jgi:hypothetical protein
MKRTILAASLAFALASPSFAGEPMNCVAFAQEMRNAAAKGDTEILKSFPGLLEIARSVSKQVRDGKLTESGALGIVFYAAGGYCLAVRDLTEAEDAAKRQSPSQRAPSIRSM